MLQDEVFTTWTRELEDAPVVVVYLCGELDASSVPALLSDLSEAINSNRSIMIDTHLLAYIDSTGLGALFSIKQALRDSDRGLCIVGAHGLLAKILKVARAEKEFRCYETSDEAMAEAVTPGW